MAKKFRIPKKAVREAFKKCQRTRAEGVNGETIREFRLNRKRRLHQLWRQLSSGKYKPTPFRKGYRRKPSGGWRTVRVPAVRDRIVQLILKKKLAAKFNTLFYPNSFLHKKGNKKRAAIETARRRCLRYNWAVILDVKDYGETVDHKILMSKLRKHVKSRWVTLYTHRMLKAPTRMRNGALVKRRKGLPKDNILSFILGDFYMHNIFDRWMKKNHPGIPFERWMDDIVIHCRTKSTAQKLLFQSKNRFRRYKLSKNPKKTKIVYCKDSRRKRTYRNVTFSFLERSFRSRKKKTKHGKHIKIFGPG